jgi:hypothetical protein
MISKEEIARDAGIGPSSHEIRLLWHRILLVEMAAVLLYNLTVP